MKISSVVASIFFLLSGGSASADEAFDRTSSANNKYITEGHWSVGGGASLSYNTSSGHGLELSGYPSAQYFIMDHLSVGGEASIAWNSNRSVLGLGPALTYYFAESEKAVWFVSEALFYSRYHYDSIGYGDFNTSNLSARTSIGMNYFLTPSVAIGPRGAFTWNSRGADTFALLFGIQIYF